MGVYLIWNEAAPGSPPKIRRARYETLEDAQRQALGDDDAPGDIAMGRHVLRIEDEDAGSVLWEP